MNRYNSTPIDKRWDGKRVYKTTQYPSIKAQESDGIIISQDGDYLDALAYKYYGDPSLWWIIAMVNDGLSTGRLSVPSGRQIRIPTNTSFIINQFNSLNSR